MKFVAGWACPDLLSGPGTYLRFNKDADMALEHVTGLASCVQAGGHIGTWPVMLAEKFERVFTFEPDFENFEALNRNLSDRKLDNVFPARGVLGHKRELVGVRKSEKSTGQHRVGRGRLVPTFRIDDLGLTDCDAIFLDVEGYEIPAVRGAEETIRRCRPVIMCEENVRCETHGYKIGDLEVLLRGFDYRKVGAVNADLIFAPAS